MKFQSLLSGAETSDQAVGDIIDAARGADIAETDVAFVFMTADHRDDAEEIVEKLWLELDPQCIVGCLAEGVIGGDREIEREPGIAVLAGRVPDVRLKPFHIATSEWQEMINDPDALAERIGVGDATRAIIGFGDPWTTPLNQLTQTLDRICPHAPLIGGMASAARQRGENVLIRNDKTHDEGFIGVSLSGPLEVETVVSQGCRPLGQTMVITKAHDNVVEQLGGRPAMQALRDMVQKLPPDDQSLLQNGLMIGRAISEYRDSFGRGDFLVRNLAGADEKSGAIAVADYVRVGQTVQFHVRDAVSADEDLRLLLAKPANNPPAAVLLFSCNGRGTRMFSESGHDIGVAHRLMPQVPVAGFFAAGEFGPVGGKNFIHGHTASFALLRNPG